MMKNLVRRNLTENDIFDEIGELSPQQIKAVDALVCGSNLTQAAEIADVSRQTVSTWFNHDEAFQSALGQRRAALWRASVVEMRSMVTDAIAAIREELKGEKRLQAAKMILELSGFTSATPIQKPDKGYLDDDDLPRVRPMSDAEVMALFRRDDDESENN